MRRTLTTVFICATAAVLAQTPLLWHENAFTATEPRPWVLDISRGETVGLRATLRDRAGHPLPLPAGAEATLYWQTNGMDTAWWSAPACAATNGQLTATWTPAMDSGAAAYSFHLAVGHGGANLYRAPGTIRMRASPGAAPNELAPPIRVIDFATVEVANPPWPAEIEHAIAGLVPYRGGTNSLVLPHEVQGTRLVAGTPHPTAQMVLDVDGAPVLSKYPPIGPVGTYDGHFLSAGARIAIDLPFYDSYRMAVGTLVQASASGGYSNQAVDVLWVDKVKLAPGTHAESVVGLFAAEQDAGDRSYTLATGNKGEVLLATPVAINPGAHVGYSPKPEKALEVHGDIEAAGDVAAASLTLDGDTITEWPDVTGQVAAATNALATVAHTGDYTDLVNAPNFASWPGIDIATNVTWNVVISNGHWLIFGTPTPTP